MKQILITNIEDEAHKKFKLFCVEKGLSLQEVLRTYIKAIAEGKNVYFK